MRIVFFGSGAFGVPTLAAIAAEHEVACVVTQPDRPAGRGGALTPTPVAAWCASRGGSIPVIRPENVNAADVSDHLRSLGADAWVVIAFGQKLGMDLRRGVLAVNLHASLLPRWRGAAPINAAVVAGDELTGNSVIALADRMDAGEVLGQTTRVIGDDLTAGELHDLLSGDGPSLVLDVLTRSRSGTLRPMMQDETWVTRARKLSRSDAWVDFTRPARECLRRVHGLTPWPGVSFLVGGSGPGDGMTELKVLRVQVAASMSEQASPGRMIGEATDGLVACGEKTVLRIVEVQPPGKRPMRWEEYARGARFAGPLAARSAITPPPGADAC
ncbi:MAG: methionyl-tRNA formyltransferase [Phycisphaeraceae bacterium]|nr:methionyl-tRNA formyltransferase [Phycisphaerae bacterium]MBX3391913.1 methionyl-tRNA formyltransferase [Phycisphaeraceae bacterium]